MRYRVLKWIRILLCYVLLIISMTILIFSNRNYNTIADKIIDFKDQNIESAYLRVSDAYDQDGQKTLSEFFAEKDALDRMKQFCNILNNKYGFLEFDTQSLLLRDSFRYRDEFRNDYGSEFFGINDDVGISLKSIQIGKNSYDHFDLKSQIISGRGFETEDFTFEDEKKIPVILGYQYMNFHDIGDTITVNYLSKDVSLSVVGFFTKNTWITINNDINFADEAIVLPFLDVHFEPQNKEDRRFQNISYSLKAWGYLEVRDGESYYVYKNEIDEISQDLHLKYMLNEGSVSNYISNISNTLLSTKGILFLFSNFIFVCLSMAVLFIYLFHYNQNREEYAVRLVSGCSLNRLKFKIYMEITLSFLLSLIIAIGINKIILGYDAIYMYPAAMFSKAVQQTMIFAMIIMFCIVLTVQYRINHGSICFALQKE